MFLTILITTKEPLSIGLESIGIKTLLYKLPVILKDGERLETPIIPGNSLRGVLRDTMAKHFILDICEKDPASQKINVDVGAALSMFSGGILAKRSTSSEESVHVLIEEYAHYLLPLSILGFAVSNTIVPGKLKVGCGYPIVKETKRLVEDLYWNETDTALEDITTTVLMTRKNDLGLISRMDEISYEEENIKKYLEVEKETAKLQQRLEREAVVAGTQFVTFVRDVIPLRPEEQGLLLKSLKQIRSLGGSTARGLGEVKLSILNEDAYPAMEKEYENFLKENISQIKEQLVKSPMSL